MSEVVTELDDYQKAVVVDATGEYVERAESIFERNFSAITVSFDLKGKSAGMYRVKSGHEEIRYNPWIFSKYFDENLSTTVPHEVAHYIVHNVFGNLNVRPHGKEWKSLMQAFDADPSRTCDFDLAGIPVRSYKTFTYRCQCQEHELTTRRHNQIVNKRKIYFCRKCKTPVQPV